jgi:hypothetical protein
MGLESFTEYRRHPIEIGEGTVIVVRLFTGFSRLDDLWMTDVPNHYQTHYEVYDEAAEQFIKQLEGHDCIAFHQALIRACQKRVDEWAARCALTTSGDAK